MTIKRTLLVPIPFMGRHIPFTRPLKPGHKEVLYRKTFTDDYIGFNEYEAPIEVLDEDRVHSLTSQPNGIVFTKEQINRHLNPEDPGEYVKNKWGFDLRFKWEPTLPSQARR